MKHGFTGWRSALAALAVTVGVGCGSDDPMVGPPGATSGGPTTGSTGGSGSTSTGATTSSTGSSATTTGTTGTPTTTSGGSSGMPTGGGVVGTTTGGDSGAPTTTGTSATGGSGDPTTTGTTGAETTGTTGTTGTDADGGATGGADAGTSTGGGMMSGACVPTDSIEGDGIDGPFTPTHIERTGPGGSSWIVYPQELGKDGMLHPVFNWGPGAGTQPSDYKDHLYKIASHGFVIISQASNRGEEVEALDWMLAKNDDSSSEFYQKLDPTRVGMGGHSMGSLQTMENASDPRLNLYILVCGGCFGGRGGCGADDIHGPTVILGATNDIGTPNYDGDYEEISAPVTFVTRTGSSHRDCARDNLEPWVAYMRWHWCGEEQWAPDFQSGGRFCSGSWEDCQSKGY